MERKYAMMLAIGICFLLTGCSKARPELLIDSFEGPLNNQTVDFGASEGSTLYIETEKALKVDGEQALKIIYDLKPSGYMWVARGFNLDVKGADQWLVRPQDIPWKSYRGFSLFMHGNKGGGMVALDIKDAGGEVWRFLLDGKFEGWKEIICPLAKFAVRYDWQPQNADKNETLDFPIMSFQFEPRVPGQGTYYFDCVKLIK